MKLRIKELLVAILNRKPQVEEHLSIVNELASTNGWTCPADGVAVIRVIASGSAVGYYINDLTANIAVANLYDNTRANNTGATTCFPVIKGHVYKQNYYAGQSRQAYYYKFK